MTAFAACRARLRVAVVVLATLTVSQTDAQAAEHAVGDGIGQADLPSVQAGSYALTTQMVLPHLDEMRRISKQERACVDDDEAARFFPVLRQPAMTGCTLVPGGADVTTREYALRCDPINGASGTARLTFTDGRVKGVLEAKMGGKNMTFSQHVEALREGECRQP